MDNIRILIVEDELIIGREIEQLLKASDYDVIGNVSSGEETLEILQNKTVDLILLDINIEGERSGIEIATIIKNKFKLPVVFLTALSDAVTLKKARVAEPYGYIVKPFEEEDLRATIEIVLYKYVKDKESNIQQMRLTQAFSYLEEAVITICDDYTVEMMNEMAIQFSGRHLRKKDGKIHVNKMVEFYTLGKEKIPLSYFLNSSGDVQGETSICYFPGIQEERKLYVRSQRMLLEDNVVGWALILSQNEMANQDDIEETDIHLSINTPQGPAISCIFAKKGKKYVRISLEDVLWFEASDNCVIIHTLKEKFVIYITLKELEVKLPPDDFLKIHRSYLIRLDKVSYCEESYVVIYEKVLPVSRSFKKIFKQKALFA